MQTWKEVSELGVLQSGDAPGCCGPVPNPSQFRDALKGLCMARWEHL